MSDYQADYISYRINKARESLKDAELLASNDSWNSCVNRLYYAAYYAVSALMLQNGVTTQTHAGLKSQFNLLYVKTGKVALTYGKLYSDLMDWRQKGDYGDMFDFDRESVEPLLVPTAEFISEIEKQISEPM